MRRHNLIALTSAALLCSFAVAATARPAARENASQPLSGAKLLAEIGDPGAGMVPLRISPCLLANKASKHVACLPIDTRKRDTASRISDSLSRAAWYIVMQDFCQGARRGRPGRVD